MKFKGDRFEARAELYEELYKDPWYQITRFGPKWVATPHGSAVLLDYLVEADVAERKKFDNLLTPKTFDTFLQAVAWCEENKEELKKMLEEIYGQEEG